MLVKNELAMLDAMDTKCINSYSYPWQAFGSSYLLTTKQQYFDNVMSRKV